MRSMTGFGRAAGGGYVAEVRSVNHRFLEVVCRLPEEAGGLESRIRDLVAARLGRGRVLVFVEREAGRQTGVPRLDRDLARAYRDELAALAADLRTGGAPSLDLLVSLPGVLSLEHPKVDEEELWGVLSGPVSQALDNLVEMREREGEALARDLAANLEEVRRRAGAVRELCPAIVAGYKERLAQRISALEPGIEVPPERLAQEVAIFADRCDISEELARLAALAEQFEEMMGRDGPVGRRLEFLLQEMGREVNTMGSKASDARVSLEVIEMKAALERLREQVQNIE